MLKSLKITNFTAFPRAELTFGKHLNIFTSSYKLGYFIWDEPEANLNPKLIKAIARTILQLAKADIQVFIATHSLFLLRELQMLQIKEFSLIDMKCFGLHGDSAHGVSVKQGATIDDVGDISALDEELDQSNRYMEAEISS
jgi:hypothetical protein